jgi:hypothetical protein
VHLVAYTAAPTFGGADVSLALLLERLDPAIDVTVVGIEPAVVERVAAARRGAATELVRPLRAKGDLTRLGPRLRALRNMRPDIFHANLHTSVAGRYELLAALLARVPVVVVEQLATINPPTRGQKLLKQFTARRLAAHVAVGERAARSIESRFGLRPDSIRVIHNAVPDRPLEQRPRLRGVFA